MKPEDISQDAWDYSAAVEHVYCGCAPGRSRTNGTSHHDSCWKKVEAHARALLAEREACALIADNHLVPSKRIASAIRNRSREA